MSSPVTAAGFAFCSVCPYLYFIFVLQLKKMLFAQSTLDLQTVMVMGDVRCGPPEMKPLMFFPTNFQYLVIYVTNKTIQSFSSAL